MNTGIYRIEIGDYFYWGSTMNYTRREREHHRGLRGGCHKNRKMQNVYDKHKDFEMNLVVFTNENILQIEQEFIDLDYDNHYCMNLAKDAIAPMLGRTHTQKTRKLMSEARKGKQHSSESRKLMSKAKQGKNHPMYGKKLSSEARKKMSQAHISPTKYTFIHNDGSVENCTQYELKMKYSLLKSGVSQMVRGKMKTYRGWRLNNE